MCAKTLDAALDGSVALSISWSKSAQPDLDDKAVENLFYEAIKKPGIVARNDGDIKLALGQAAKQLEATYFLPYLAHATMEPMNCTAHIGKERCRILAPTQAQTAVQLTGSKISGLPLEKVDVFTTYCGGGSAGVAKPWWLSKPLSCPRSSVNR